ncbi:hypothetical protein K9L97_01605 [Candidatus Woesearchaeota archaeon]|nr:hypothetical protein [Candidatus Woesearchaeota archaeon]
MSEALSIIYFFATIYLYGFAANKIFSFSNLIDKQIYVELAKLCVGFGLYNLFIFVFGLLNIPLMPLLILIPPVLVMLVYLIIAQKGKINLSLESLNILKSEKKTIPLILIVCSVVAFVLLLTGSFSYPYLEDGDPWAYASGAEYVSQFHTYKTEDPALSYNFYLFPHSTPTLTAHYGLIFQITSNNYWAMKFFINVYIWIAFISVFLFVYILTKKELQALISSLILMIVPSFIGHFIFNYTLAISLLCVMLIGLALAKTSKKQTVLAALLLASVLMSHQIVAIQAGIITILFFLVILYEEFVVEKKKEIFKTKAATIFLVGILAIMLCLIYYGDFIGSVDVNSWYQDRASSFISFSEGSITYDLEPNPLSEFFIAKNVSRMDQQEGIGLLLFSICLLAIPFMYFYRKQKNKNHTFYALMFLFYLVFLWILTGGIFKFSVQNYRWWSVMAIGVALIAGWFLYSLWTQLRKKPAALITLFVLIAIGLIVTSAIPRYTVQRSYWGPGVQWTSNEELVGYVELKTLPDETPVYSACQEQKTVIAMNKESYPWIQEVRDYDAINKSTENTYNFLRKYEYEYIIFSSKCAADYGPDATNSKLQEVSKDSRFQLIRRNNGFLLFKIL